MNQELEAKCACAHCGGHIAFPIEAGGATVACPHCQQSTELVLDLPSAVEQRPSAASILSYFAGTITRSQVSVFYQLGLVLVTLVMIILPVFYVLLIVAVGWGVYWYAVHCLGLLSLGVGGGRVFLVKVLLYITPLFAGVVILFFMVKPLFARRRHRAQPLAMNPALEPSLYAFIAKICDLVGAPMPRRIDLNCDLNASASFRRGLRSLFGNDVVLTIGLPLVAGLNLREFAGVVAHEFGHFTQGFGMRLSYIVRVINAWFARVVYERDAWDLTLEEWRMGVDDVRIQLLIGVAQFGVGFSRLVLKLLMFFGHGVSCFLLRQMEYDADSYEIKLAGSDTFEATARRLAVLEAGLEKSYLEMRTTWNLSRKLPNDFPAYLLKQCSKLPAQACEKIQDTLGLQTTGLFDTHPSNGDRIRCARRARQPGIFHLELPASILFSHFDIVSRQVTQLHYNDDIGLNCDASNLRVVESEAATAAS